MIEIKDISFGYGGKLNSVFKDFSLTIEPGRIYGLLGKNGTGKSTLLYLIAGLLRPFKGEVTVDGKARFLVEQPHHMEFADEEGFGDDFRIQIFR